MDIIEEYNKGRREFHRINLFGENLYNVNLAGVNLTAANLSNVNLYKTNLEGASLYAANLYGANLCETNLERVNLKGANLHRANIEGVNLKGAFYCITQMLLAEHWALSDKLTLECMRWDAMVTTTDAMNNWAINSSLCPCTGENGTLRIINFHEDPSLWKEGKPKLNLRELWEAIAKEKNIKI